MGMKLFMGAAAAIAVAIPGAFGLKRLALRRQRVGALQLANTLHLNARWWKEQGTQAGTLLYVAIGDSAAQGVGASLPGRSYVGLVAAHLRSATGHSVRVINLSVSGARLQDALEAQLPDLQKLKPDVLTVAIGANDIATFERGSFERQLAELFDGLPAGAIVSEIPAFYLGANERNARLANNIVRRLARARGFAIAPLHHMTIRQGVARYALNQVAADFFHPNDRGYRVWASAFIPIVDRLLLLNTSTIGEALPCPGAIAR